MNSLNVCKTECQERTAEEGRQTMGGSSPVFRFTGNTTSSPPPPPPYFTALNTADGGSSSFSYTPVDGNCNSEKYAAGCEGTVSGPANILDDFLIRHQQAANHRMYPQTIPAMTPNMNVLQPIGPYETNNQSTHRLPQRSAAQCQPQNAQHPPVKKAKRPRTAYSSSQLLALESAFMKERYLNRSGRINISRDLDLSEKQVKVWFQNRRMKHKKEAANKTAAGEDCSDSTRSTPTPDKPGNGNRSSSDACAGAPSPQQLAGYDAASAGQYQLPPPYMATEQAWQYQYQLPQHQLPQHQLSHHQVPQHQLPQHQLPQHQQLPPQHQFQHYQYQSCQYQSSGSGLQFWSDVSGLEMNGTGGHETALGSSIAQQLGMINGTSQGVPHTDLSGGYQEINGMLNNASVEQLMMNGLSNGARATSSSSGSPPPLIDPEELTPL